MTPRHRLAAAAIVALAGCSSADADAGKVAVDTLAGGITRTITTSPVDSGRWVLVRDHVVQPPEGADGELMNPTDIAISDNGTLLIAESNPTEVKVFDASGAFLRRIGRKGSGPGEFNAAWIAVHGDTLVVQDPGSSRGSMFLVSTGAFLTSRQTTCCYWYTLGIDGQGRAVARAMIAPDSGAPPVQGFVRFGLGGTTIDTARIPLRREAIDETSWKVGDGKVIRFARSVPLRPADIHAVDRTGGFITGWNGEYRLRVTRDGSDTVAIFGRNLTPIAVSAAEKQAIVDRIIAQDVENGSDVPEDVLRKAYNPADIPDVRPAFEGVWTDPAGRRWVRVATGDTTQVTLDLFDPAGRWLDQLEVPAADWGANAWSPVALSRDRAAVIREGEDGRPMVVVYRIERR